MSVRARAPDFSLRLVCAGARWNRETVLADDHDEKNDKKRSRANASGATRRDILAGSALAAGAAGAMGAASPSAGDERDTFAGRIGPTLDQSEPDYATRPTAPEGSPNIVLIVVDDVGFSDLGCYGGEIPTPAIDALAAQGVRYTNFRTTGVCSATRASLHTGLNPHRAGIGWLTFFDGGYPGYRGDLAPDATTLAESLEASGYVAYHSGKWHINAADTTNSTGPVENWPLQRGFTRAYWFQGHSTDYFRPSQFYDGNERIDVDAPDYYVTDDITERAIAFLRDHVAQRPDAPFFLSLAHPAAHSPLHAPAEDIARHRGRYDVGWDEIRTQRLARQKELGLMSPDIALAPLNRGVEAWSDLSRDDQRLYARYMEVYAAVMERLDASVANLTEALRSLGLEENTMVVLLSDNGGSPDGGIRGTPNLFAGRNGGVTNARALEMLDEIGGPDTYPMYPMGWATASNTPYRLYKHTTHLGGVADPLIVRWPRGVEARDELRSQYVHVCDLMPTLLACAGAEPLATRDGAPTRPIEGLDFSASLTNADAASARTSQHYELNGLRAYYEDGWRIVSSGRFGEPDERWELFDVRVDPNETNDLAAEHPELVEQLDQRWLDAAHRYDVFPIDTRSLFLKSFTAFLEGRLRPDWTLYPPVDLVPEETAPRLIGRDFDATIELAPLQANDEGALFVFGSAFMGLGLYAQNGQLVFERAALPTFDRRAMALPVGAARLEIRHRHTQRPWRGVTTIAADGAVIAELQYERLLFGAPAQGLQIGRNTAVPLNPALETPFAFTGDITRVDIHVDASPYTEAEIAGLSPAPPLP